MKVIRPLALANAALAVSLAFDGKYLVAALLLAIACQLAVVRRAA